MNFDDEAERGVSRRQSFAESEVAVLLQALNIYCDGPKYPRTTYRIFSGFVVFAPILFMLCCLITAANYELSRALNYLFWTLLSIFAIGTPLAAFDAFKRRSISGLISAVGNVALLIAVAVTCWIDNNAAGAVLLAGGISYLTSIAALTSSVPEQRSRIQKLGCGEQSLHAIKAKGVDRN